DWSSDVCSSDLMHISNSINAVDVGLIIIGVVNLNSILFNLQSPVADRSQFWGKPEQRNEMIGFLHFFICCFTIMSYNYSPQMIFPFQVYHFGIGDKIDLPYF